MSLILDETRLQVVGLSPIPVILGYNCEPQLTFLPSPVSL